MRFVKWEARRSKAHSLMAAMGQSVCQGVQNTVASRNVEEASGRGKDLDRKNNHEEKEGLELMRMEQKKKRS